jgi:hypothetical protein
MLYNPELEQFRDFVEFGPDSPCIWVVYPAGCAGDLVASTINFHYADTAAKFKGVTPQGQVIFRPSDQKISNLYHQQSDVLTFDQQFFFDIAEKLSNTHTHYSKLDQFIFSAHAFSPDNVHSILNKFSRAKIIRILPKNEYQDRVRKWLALYKNNGVTTQFDQVTATGVSMSVLPPISHVRLLDIGLSDFLDPKQFDATYLKILSHLNLEFPLIRYDFVQYWLDRQDSYIKPFIAKMFAS